MNSTSEKNEFRKLSWLKKRTKLEKILCFVTVILLLMFLTVVIAFAFAGHLYDANNNNPIALSFDNLLTSENLCVTPICVKTASTILSSLDETVDPCNDFYRFVCGEWLKKVTIPDDKPAVSIHYEAIDNLNLQLKTLVEKKLDGTEPLYIKMMKEMYDTCMDLKSIDKTGAKPLEDVLKSLGGWPVVEGKKWDENKFDWTEALISLRKFGYNHNIILSSYVFIDYRLNKLHTLVLDQPTFGMPDRTYLIKGLNESSTNAYYKQMVQAAVLLGAAEDKAEKELLDALQFEMTLANYSLPQEERRNVSKLYNKYTIKQLQEMIPEVPWLRYINGILTVKVYENETLTVAVPEFMKMLADLLSRTEKRVIANYIFWRVVDESLPLLSNEWREIAFNYKKVLIGRSQEKPRWKQCLSQLDENLGIALGSYYVHHFLEDEIKDEIQKIIKYVHREFLRILEEIDWMDKKTKAHAIEKASNIIFYVGCPKELLNNSVVIEHYQDLTISNASYFENILRLKKWSTDNEMSKLRKPNIRRDWKKFAKVAVVDAFYTSSDNIIDIPAGYLQYPFFVKDRPNYMNFASMGSTIGHEITHGFDDKGRQYDKDGNNINWWAEITDKRFRDKAQCIIDQYSNYTAENGMNLNGVITQGENIADNGGLTQSYLAYQSWVKDNGPDKLLPGLKYNQNQLFWIAAGYEWCTKYRPEEMKRRIFLQTHSLNEFRVTGPLSNLVEFSKDFNCPLGSPMNKKHKCKVW